MIRHILGKSWRIVNKILRKINHSPHSFEQINSPLERENLHSLKILANFLAPIRNSENAAAIINNLRLCSENLLKDAQISHWKRHRKIAMKKIPFFPCTIFSLFPFSFFLARLKTTVSTLCCRNFISISQINENRFRKHQRPRCHKTLAPREGREKKIGGCFTIKGLIRGIHGYWIHNHIKTSITVRHRCKSLKH